MCPVLGPTPDTDLVSKFHFCCEHILFYNKLMVSISSRVFDFLFTLWQTNEFCQLVEMLIFSVLIIWRVCSICVCVSILAHPWCVHICRYQPDICSNASNANTAKGQATSRQYSKNVRPLYRRYC